MGEVKHQGRIVDPVPNLCTSFSFKVSRTNHSLDMADTFWHSKTYPQFCNKIHQNSFQPISSKFNEAINMSRVILLPSLVVI